MKRFFVVSSIAIIFTVLICVLFGSALYVAVPLFVLLIIGVLLSYKYKCKFFKSLLSFTLISVVMFVYTSVYISQRNALTELVGTTQTFDCVLVEEPKATGNYYTYIVKPLDKSFEQINFNFKIKLNCSFNVGASAYDRMKVCADLRELAKDNLYSNYADNIRLSGKLRYCSFEITKNKPLSYFIKRSVVDTFTSLDEGDLAGIPIAILTGDKSYLSSTFYYDVKTTGMAHVMAVSGFHISVICMTIVMWMRKLKFGRKPAAAVGLLLLFILMGVAGFTGSVLRAGLMYIIMFTGELISRRPDALNSLGFSVTVLSIINPYSIFSVSLQLSALGTLGILLLTPRMTEAFVDNVRLRGKVKKAYGYVAQIFIVSFSAGLFVMPVSLLTFGYVSIISVAVNLFITLPVYINIFSSIFCVVFYKIPLISNVVILVSKASSTTFKYIISSFAELDFAVFYKNDIMLYAILVSWIALSIIIIIYKNKFVVTFISLVISVSVFITSIFIQMNINSKSVSITYFPTSSGHLVLVGSGGEYTLISSTSDSYALNEAYYFLYEGLHDTINYTLIASDDSNVIEKTIALSELLDFENIRLGKNVTQIKLKNAELNIAASDGEYDILIYLTNETLTIDNSGNSAYKTDYILTRNPILSYKLNGKHSKYIIDGDREETIMYSALLSEQGIETAILGDFGTIKSNKFGDNLLKFSR